MAPVSNPADDAATEALIARLIAEDFGENIDSLRIGGSVEDYEDPLSSYERGVIDGTISDIPSWGDPLSDTSDSGPCAGTEIPEYTGEGWDDSAAWNETSCTDESDRGVERRGRCEDDTKQPPDIKWCVLAPTSMIRTRRRASSVPNLDNTNATHPAIYFQRSSSDVLPQPFTPPTSDPTFPDTVSDSPVLGPQRDTPTSRLVSHRDPSPLELDRASSPVQATVLHPRKKVSGRSRSELSPPFDASQPVLPVKSTKEEGVGRATVWHKPNRCHQPYNPAELVVPRFSAADRYTGLDIDYSSSKSKGRARAFDRSNVDADNDDDDDDHHSADFQRLMRDFERNFCESDSLLDDWHDSDGDDSPLIYIPFPGLSLGRDEQEIRRLEDLAVVEIHVGEEETLESILNDICSPSDQKARVRLEASVSRAVLSTGTQASADTTSAEASSTLGTQGSTDSTSFGPSTSSDGGLRGRTSRGNGPPMRSLREERRRAYYRDRKGWKPKKNDAELLLGVQVRSEDEILKKMPKQGEEKEEEEEEEDEEASRGRKRKSKARKHKGKGKGKEEKAEKEDGEASGETSIEREALPLSGAPAEGVQEIEGEGSS